MNSHRPMVLLSVHILKNSERVVIHKGKNKAEIVDGVDVSNGVRPMKTTILRPFFVRLLSPHCSPSAANQCVVSGRDLIVDSSFRSRPSK